jgi:hypothetical protein
VVDHSVSQPSLTLSLTYLSRRHRVRLATGLRCRSLPPCCEIGNCSKPKRTKLGYIEMQNDAKRLFCVRSRGAVEGEYVCTVQCCNSVVQDQSARVRQAEGQGTRVKLLLAVRKEPGEPAGHPASRLRHPPRLVLVHRLALAL